MSDELKEGESRPVVVEFVRCQCGREYGHTINLLDGKPVWTPPKRRRGEECKHEPEQAMVLKDGEWISPHVQPL